MSKGSPFEKKTANAKEFNGLWTLIENKDVAGVKDYLLDSEPWKVNALQNSVTPLYLACEKNLPEIAEEILKADANPDMKSRDGETPLFAAITGGYSKIVRLLVTCNANVNEYTHGTPLLHVACSKANKLLTQVLVVHEANVNAKSKTNGESALHVSAARGSVELTTYLILCNADIHATNDEGDTPLHIASKNGQSGIVRTLIDFSVHLDTRNKRGETALYLACTHGHNEVVQVLLRENADVYALDKEGKSPTQLAADKVAKQFKDCYSAFSGSLRSCLQSGQFSDINFTFASDTTDTAPPLPAHSSIIAARSAKLGALIEKAKVNGGGATPLEISLPSTITRAGFILFLELLYTDRFPFEADQQALCEAQKLCEDYGSSRDIAICKHLSNNSNTNTNNSNTNSDSNDNSSKATTIAPSTYFDDFLSLYQQAQQENTTARNLADVKIVLEESKTFYGHKVLLATNSFFNILLKERGNVDILTIDDLELENINERTLGACLLSVYGRKAPVFEKETKENVELLLTLAHKYNVTELTRHVENHFAQHVVKDKQTLLGCLEVANRTVAGKKRLRNVLMTKLIDMIALNSLDTLDLKEDLQEEILSMPAFYRRTPRRVANTNGSNVAQKSPSSYKKSPLAAVKNPGGSVRRERASSMSPTLQRTSSTSVDEERTRARSNSDSEDSVTFVGLPPHAGGGGSPGLGRRNARIDKPKETPSWFKELETITTHDTKGMVPSISSASTISTSSSSSSLASSSSSPPPSSFLPSINKGGNTRIDTHHNTSSNNTTLPKFKL